MLFDPEYEKRYKVLINDIKIANEVWCRQHRKFSSIFLHCNVFVSGWIITKSIWIPLVVTVILWLTMYLIYMLWCYFDMYKKLELYKWK